MAGSPRRTAPFSKGRFASCKTNSCTAQSPPYPKRPTKPAVIPCARPFASCSANLQNVKNHANLQIVIDSISNEARLVELVEAADEVYHLAAVVGVRLVLEHPVRTVTTNVGPTETLLHLCAGSGDPGAIASV